MTDLAALLVVSCDWMRGWKYAIKSGCTVHVPPEVYSLLGDGPKTVALVCQHLQVVEIPLMKFLPPDLPAPDFDGFRVGSIRRKGGAG